MAVAVEKIKQAAGGGNGPAPVIPFRKASLHKRTLDETKSPSAALGSRHVWPLPQKGFVGHLRILVSGAEVTTLADPTASADFPWSMARRIELRDSSAGMLHSCRGYSNYLATRYFQPLIGRNLATSADTRIYDVDINTVATNQIRFAWDVYVEAGTKDNLGLVPNQNAAFKYTLDLELVAEADVVTTPGNAAWDQLVLQPSYEYYTVPAPQRVDGALQQPQPPFTGVLRQVWDEPALDVPSTGVAQKVKLNPGKVIRGLILVTRTDTAAPGAYQARAGGLSRVSFKYGDDVILWEATEQDIIDNVYKRYGEVPPTGVYPLTFADDSDTIVGADFRRDVLDTRELTDLWMEVTFAAGTGNVDIIHDELIVPRNLSL